MAHFGEPVELTGPRYRTAAALALAPRHVRNWIFGREALLRYSPFATSTIETAVSAWLGRTSKPKSFAYFGPANDASLIGPAHATFGYDHFVYVDIAPAFDGLYDKQTMTKLQASLKRQIIKQGYEIHKITPDPANSRFLMYMRKRVASLWRGRNKKNVVLEYYYDTEFEMLETPRARQTYRPLLVSKLKKARALTCRGAALPRVRFATLFPCVTQTWYLDGGIEDLLNSPQNKANIVRKTGVRSEEFERKIQNARAFHDQETLTWNAAGNQPAMPRYAAQVPLFQTSPKRWILKKSSRKNQSFADDVPQGLGLAFSGLLPTPLRRRT